MKPELPVSQAHSVAAFESITRRVAAGLLPADATPPSLKEARAMAWEPVEQSLIEESLLRNAWNVTKTAEALSISRRNLQQLMKKHGIRRSQA